MPLSEDEQRILREIEASLSESDPQLVQLSETTVYRHAWRNIKWAALGAVVCLVVLVLTFTISMWFGAVAFLGMLGCSWIIAVNVQKLGRAGMHSVSTQLRGGSLGSATKQWRDRFRRD
ncbi:MAG: DUF3040 domain-containing protein [Acidimicrobiia bacterium]